MAASTIARLKTNASSACCVAREGAQVRVRRGTRARPPTNASSVSSTANGDGAGSCFPRSRTQSCVAQSTKRASDAGCGPATSAQYIRRRGASRRAARARPLRPPPTVVKANSLLANLLSKCSRPTESIRGPCEQVRSHTGRWWAVLRTSNPTASCTAVSSSTWPAVTNSSGPCPLGCNVAVSLTLE
eukprot:scaffold60268_cov27-Tisochrysis_lutea.AAC.12